MHTLVSVENMPIPSNQRVLTLIELGALCSIGVFLFVLVGISIFMTRLFFLQMSSANNFSIKEFFGSFQFWPEWLWHVSMCSHHKYHTRVRRVVVVVVVVVVVTNARFVDCRVECIGIDVRHVLRVAL
jgi:hypothetical protein